MAKTVVSFPIEAEQLERLDKVSARLGRSRSEMLRGCLEVGLREAEGAASALESPVVRLVVAAMCDPEQRLELERRMGETIPDLVFHGVGGE